MSDTLGNGSAEEPNVDDLYAALLDEAGVGTIPGSASGSEKPETVAPEAMATPSASELLNPAPVPEVAYPGAPEVSRTSYVQPDVAVTDAGFPSAPPEHSAAEQNSATPDQLLSAAKPRPTFDEVLYGTSILR